MNNDGRVFDRLFGPSEPPSASSVGERVSLPRDVAGPGEWGDGRDGPPTVHVDAMLRAIDKLEACVARLKRFLMLDGRGVK